MDSRVIGVLSGKGGVGKTSVVANLGAALVGEFGANSVIVDANLGSSHLGMHIGMYGDSHATIHDVMSGKTSASEAVHIHPSIGVKILPASIGGGKHAVSESKLKGIARRLAQDYDIVLMDCPPGLGREVVSAIHAIDSGIIVTTPDFPSVAAALKTVNLLQRMKKGVAGVVVNKRGGKRHELTDREIESTCGVKVIGTIPDDDQIPSGISKGVPAVVISPGSRSSRAFKQLAGRIVGRDYKSPNFISALLGSLRFSGISISPVSNLGNIVSSIEGPAKKKK